MWKVVALLSLFGYALAFPVDDERVVGGTDAELGEFPYIVSLRSFISHSCGGSILDATHILTAAHCVDSTGSMSIQYGVVKISAFGPNIIHVSKAKIHENYSPWNNHANDIAVLTLESPITFSKNAQPVALPEQDEAPPAGGTSVLAGWGDDRTGGSIQRHLQKVDLLVYSDADCTKAYGGRTDPKYHVCSGVPEGGKGQCSGDSGGPLVANGKQIGAVSWSVRPCAIKGHPGVYTRIGNYVDWIKTQMKSG